MPAPHAVLDLIERFELNRPAYRSGQYNEAQVRVEFIDPLFELLGWDMTNQAGYAEAYKDVVHEDSLRVGGATEAPDYCFRIGGARKFFLEAKKPSVNLKDDISPAFQLRRYAWSAKLPLSILTDFEELALYDCRVKPDKSDKAATARTIYLTYREYAARWDELAGIFSREAILKGSFDRYVESTKAKKGTAEVDDAFLQEIESWRDTLAQNIALRNAGLSQRDLDYTVQTTIDRLIFLRIGEDRGIEDYGRLLALTNSGQVYARLCDLFHRADERYNSGLFHFNAEKGRSEPCDGLTLSLSIDDRPLKDIITSLYYPDSPYEFSVLPADILGQVYEQFLGKVIRLTAGHHAVVEDKPEVKKAGGVYYTPTYIVDYIVKNTLGTLLAGKTPRQVANLRLLDPACGSGSFLIGAYQCLLDWHRDWYLANEPKKWATGRAPALYQGSGGAWQLTTGERKRILLNNIYGVDIDPQAVEVSKLSLLLKVLEGETEQTLQTQLRLFQERALPDLSSNIKCGNSLIGPDFYDSRQMSLLGEEERYRINVFDWQQEFAEVFSKGGGFDVVIGNPPYIRIQALKEWAPLEVEFYKKRYAAASKGNYDIYVVFVEKGLTLLNSHGRLGFILPHKFFNAQYGEPLRALLAKGKHLSHVVHFGDQQVFETATTYTCLMFLHKAGSAECDLVKVDDLAAWRVDGQATRGSIAAATITPREWNFTIGRGAGLFDKLSQMPVKLGDVTQKIYQGLVTSSDPVYLLTPLGAEEDGHARVMSAATGREYLLESATVPLLCKGSRDIRRYVVAPSKRVLFPYDVKASQASGKSVLISSARFDDQFPAAWSYLKENESLLRDRERGKMRHDGWYGYVYPKSVGLFGKRKILTPSIALHPSYYFDSAGDPYFVGSGGGGGGGYGIILKDDTPIAYEYALALLNSRVLDYYLQQISTRFRGGYFAYNRQYIEQLPIRVINFADPADKTRHDPMVGLVENMLALHRQLGAAKTAFDKAATQRQIEATDRQIDRLVYELYGLTEAIGVVEGG